MHTMMKHHRTMSWFVHARKGMVALCFLLVLMGLATPSAFAASHSQHTASTATNSASHFRLKHLTELGTFDFGGITMVTKKVGWTFTNKVQRTSDGGKTWQTVAQGNTQEYIGQVEVLDDQTAWYLADDAQTFTPTALYRTNDGGQTWTRFPWIDPAQQLISISVFDGQYAWVNTADFSGANAVYHLFLVGGTEQNWQEATEPSSDGANSIYFLSTKVGWATLAMPGNYGPIWTLYETRDGGQTWAQQDLPTLAGLPDTATVSNIRFLGFGDQGEGYLTATFGDSTSYMQYATTVYRTLDGGKSWQSYGAPADGGYIVQLDQWHVPSLFLVTTANLAMLSHGTWASQQVTFPGSAEMLSFFSDRLMFVSALTPDGSAQVLYKTQDGGASWQTVATVAN
jgi:photosystem II stability/assembly factor-like uncharacterized protein